MPEINNIILVLILVAFFFIANFVYYMTFSKAIKDALREHDGERFFNDWLSIGLVMGAMIAYLLIANPRWGTTYESINGNSLLPFLLFLSGLFYLAFEIPYMLVKNAAKDFVEQIVAAGDDKRQTARAKSAEVLADIVRRKLKVSCDLQAISNNEEFVFLTYIVNNKPIATRLKFSQADNPENWKKLGEWMITNYQKESQGRLIG